jgi:hypothetical protein
MAFSLAQPAEVKLTYSISRRNKKNTYSVSRRQRVRAKYLIVALVVIIEICILCSQPLPLAKL